MHLGHKTHRENFEFALKFIFFPFFQNGEEREAYSCETELSSTDEDSKHIHGGRSFGQLEQVTWHIATKKDADLLEVYFFHPFLSLRAKK